MIQYSLHKKTCKLCPHQTEHGSSENGLYNSTVGFQKQLWLGDTNTQCFSCYNHSSWAHQNKDKLEYRTEAVLDAPAPRSAERRSTEDTKEVYRGHRGSELVPDPMSWCFSLSSTSLQRLLLNTVLVFVNIQIS